MIIVKKRTVGLILLLILFYLGFVTGRYLNRPRIRLGDQIITVNYRAKIDPKRTYHLQLWDYDWPGEEGKAWYQTYLRTAIKHFEREYPNIRVQSRFLDLLEGPERIRKALATGTAPDVYCSAYDIPQFDYRWQIPLGIFLDPKELDVYFKGLRTLVTLDDYWLTLPRWVVPGIWIGNRKLMEKAGFSIAETQKHGWSWDDLTNKNLPRPFCAGNLSSNGILSQLLLTGRQMNNIPNVADTLNFISLICGPFPKKTGDMLEQFLSERVMILAGVRPIIFGFLKDKLAVSGADWEPVILPVPGKSPGPKFIPVECGVIGIYRNKKTKRDDQLAAAARLAYFLSTYHQIDPWLRLRVAPAVSSLAREWAQSSDLTGYGGPLIDWLTGTDLVNLKQCPKYYETIYPMLNGFYIGKDSQEELEEILLKNYYPGN